EIPPADEGDAECAEIARRRNPQSGSLTMRLISYLTLSLENSRRIALAKRQLEDHRSRAYSRNRLDSPYEFAVETGDLLLFCIFRLRQIHAQGQNLMRIEAGVDHSQPLEAVDQQSCADEQHQGKCHLCYNQRASKTVAPQSLAAASAIVQRICDA